MRNLRALAPVVAIVTVVLVAAGAASAGQTQSTAAVKSCAFELRIGNVLPFTGDLAAYGGNMDRAVKLAVNLQNAALKRAGLAGTASVIIGEMASGATIPMAQSVTIPNNVVQISPTSSAPQISLLKDKGLLFRTYPSDTLQGKVLAQAALTKFGKGATINVGARAPSPSRGSGLRDSDPYPSAAPYRPCKHHPALRALHQISRPKSHRTGADYFP